MLKKDPKELFDLWEQIDVFWSWAGKWVSPWLPFPWNLFFRDLSFFSSNFICDWEFLYSSSFLVVKQVPPSSFWIRWENPLIGVSHIQPTPSWLLFEPYLLMDRINKPTQWHLKRNQNGVSWKMSRLKWWFKVWSFICSHLNWSMRQRRENLLWGLLSLM